MKTKARLDIDKIHPEILKNFKGTQLSEIQSPANNFLQKANNHFQKAEENMLEALASLLNLIFISRDRSAIKELQTNYPELINFDLMKKAFKKRKDLIDFVDFGTSSFNLKVKKTIPWHDFSELKMKLFRSLPINYKTEEACFKWIKGIKNIKTSRFRSIPRRILKKLCQDNKEFRDFLLSVLMNEDKWDVDIELLGDLFDWSFTKDQSYWEDEAKILFYLEAMHAQGGSELITGFNDYPGMIKKSVKIQQAILQVLFDLLDNAKMLYCECGYDDSGVKIETKEYLDKHSDFFSSINIDFFESLDSEDMSSFLDIIQVLKYHKIDYFTPLQLAFFEKHTKKFKNYSYIYPPICPPREDFPF